MHSENLPDVGPLETNSTHVVVRDLDQLLEGEETRTIRSARRLDLLPRDVAEGLNELDDGGLGNEKISGQSEEVVKKSRKGRLTPERCFEREKTMSAATVT